jgi:glutathione synthase/RimK-type ligase-like ATP-grasp enzyme
MKISYDPLTAQWYHSENYGPVTFGGDRQHIHLQESHSQCQLEFQVNISGSHAGPLVGIMTTRKNDGSITGNSDLFMKLQKELIPRGGLSYIFTPEDSLADRVIGYIFLPEYNCWKKAAFPYPDIVYNRIPFRKTEQSGQCQSFFTILKQKNIPFFNPGFLDKFELYSLLQSSDSLKPFLPDTELVKDPENLSAFLLKYPRVYLKPTLSSKGKGIYRLIHKKLTDITLEGLLNKTAYSSFQSFWEAWELELTKKHYLVQEEINSALYEGKKFDLRILAHGDDGHYRVTGVGIRQAQKQDLTTHVPNGGRLLPYQLIKTNDHDQFIKKAVNDIGKILSNYYGYFGEFSIDAGISANGEYYLYEVNSKPMSFDESDIEKQKISRLSKLFFQMSNFPFKNEESLKLTN